TPTVARSEFTGGRGACPRIFRKASHDGVLACGLAEPPGAELGRALLGLEIDVDQPEAVAEARGPFEVVHRAPVEIPLDGDAFGGGTLELRQVRAEEHDAVGVVDGA